MLSEISQIRKNIYHLVSLVGGILKKKKAEFRETE